MVVWVVWLYGCMVVWLYGCIVVWLRCGEFMELSEGSQYLHVVAPSQETAADSSRQKQCFLLLLVKFC
jgi:hypothetical protein